MPEADPDEEAGPGAPSAVPRLPQALALTCEDRRPWGTAINGALMPPTVFWTLPGAPKHRQRDLAVNGLSPAQLSCPHH